MADVVSFVAERLAALLIEEVTLKGVRAEFQHLQIKLVSILEFLETVDSIHIQDRGFHINIWVAAVRDIAYDIDNIIDSFLLQEEGINNFFKHCARKLKNIFKHPKAGKDFNEIFSKLDDISERQKKLDTTNLHERTTSSNAKEFLLRHSYPYQRNDDIIGLEVQKSSLVAELMKEEERVRVVSIYGMGGIGKSTLAKEVYNHRNVKSHFECFAWIFISQQMNIRQTLQEILRKVSNTSSLEPMQEEELLEKIYEILKGKRYLVVLDDIWSPKDWDVLKPAFPNSKGSQIMLTTRNKQVAEHADPWSCHYEPRSLTDEEAWELLCKKAFHSNVISSSYSLSSDKEQCGRNMVKKCGGLPLAIVVLGGLLASKSSFNEWESVSKKIGTMGRGSGDDDVVLSILSLSYIELPFYLKPLFLYFGLFQEDSNIPVKKLICMWMAESLIKNQGGETLEEVGRRYLDELTDRCMIRIVEKSLKGGRAKTCRIHTKMRDLCIDIGKKENFFEVVSHQNSDSASSTSSHCSKLRRCTIYIEEESNQYVFRKHPTLCLRTIFFTSNTPFQDCPNMVYDDFKLLKVLNFQGCLELGEKVCRILKKLSNLRYLETSGKANLICSQLHQLRHLYTKWSDPITLSKINKMTKLQTLWIARAGPWMIDLAKLTNLGKLGICGLDDQTMELLTIAFRCGGLDKLRSLFLHVGDVFSSDLLEALSEKHYLKKLLLIGEMKKLPSQWPSKLIKLSLEGTHLSEDPIPTFEKLKHLLFLQLWDSYKGKQMVCSTKGFPKLQHLKISICNQLEEWVVEEGAMPCLLTCQISCTNLKMVPQGFKFFTMLQELKFSSMPESFVQRVKEGGEDWDTIKQIPSFIVQ